MPCAVAKRSVLESSIGRTAVLTLLYFNEGLPNGFTLSYLTTLLRQAGYEPDVIGWFVAAQFLPWSFKWLAGPFVDFYTLRKFKRRFWIWLSQVRRTAPYSAQTDARQRR
jgi:hypothetical protein